MKTRSCPHEEAVTAAARSGEWSDELRDHREGCLICAELTLVVAALAGDAGRASVPIETVDNHQKARIPRREMPICVKEHITHIEGTD